MERSTEFDDKTKQRDNDGPNDISSNTFQNEEFGVTLSEVQKSVKFFRTTSKIHNDTEHIEHGIRNKVLDELELSFVYAAEMKRAAMSAKSWLQSVCKTSDDGKIGTYIEGTKTQFGIPSETSLMLSFHEELEMTKKVNVRLNQELSTCRAEIGRLKTVGRNEVRKSRNNQVFFCVCKMDSLIFMCMLGRINLHLLISLF